MLVELNKKKKLLKEQNLKEHEDTLLQHVEYGKKLQLDLKEMLIDLRLNEYELDVLDRLEFQAHQVQVLYSLTSFLFGGI